MALCRYGRAVRECRLTSLSVQRMYLAVVIQLCRFVLSTCSAGREIALPRVNQQTMQRVVDGCSYWQSVV